MFHPGRSSGPTSKYKDLVEVECRYLTRILTRVEPVFRRAGALPVDLHHRAGNRPKRVLSPEAQHLMQTMVAKSEALLPQ
jgi:hypothetical protein